MTRGTSVRRCRAAMGGIAPRSRPAGDAHYTARPADDPGHRTGTRTVADSTPPQGGRECSLGTDGRLARRDGRRVPSSAGSLFPAPRSPGEARHACRPFEAGGKDHGLRRREIAAAEAVQKSDDRPTSRRPRSASVRKRWTACSPRREPRTKKASPASGPPITASCNVRRTLRSARSETRLRNWPAGADGLAALQRELEQSAPEDSQSEQQEQDAAVNALEQEKESAVRAERELDPRVATGSKKNSDEISLLRIQQQADLAKFRSHAREWAVLKIASHLIDRRGTSYERERRPAVLKQAETLLRGIDARAIPGNPRWRGRSPGRRADGGRKELAAQPATAEQLYLSIAVRLRRRISPGGRSPCP